MRHDPERLAAAYLGGELTRRRRERFESHMLGCDACWHEVTAARRGRNLAEALREVTPQRVRERIRGLAALTPQPPPRRMPGLGFPLLLATGVVLAVLVVVGGAMLWRTPGQEAEPAPLTAAVAAYQQPGGDWNAASSDPPVSEIGALTWRGMTSRSLGGQPVALHLYADNAGHRLLVARSPQPFPEAAHVDPIGGGPSWVATIDGTVIFCVDRPAASWLTVGETRAQVLAAGRALGLR